MLVFQLHSSLLESMLITGTGQETIIQNQDKSLHLYY